MRVAETPDWRLGLAWTERKEKGEKETPDPHPRDLGDPSAEKQQTSE